jgi:hypothetical protein
LSARPLRGLSARSGLAALACQHFSFLSAQKQADKSPLGDVLTSDGEAGACFYIDTPSKPRVNWKSVLPAAKSLGVYSLEATAPTARSI